MQMVNIAFAVASSISHSGSLYTTSVVCALCVECDDIFFIISFPSKLQLYNFHVFIFFNGINCV